MNDAPAPKTDPHVCNQVYTDVNNLTQTWLTWLLHASVTPNAQLPTVHVMDNRIVALVTPNHCSLEQCSLSEMTVNQHYRLHEMIAWSTASTLPSYLHGVLMLTCSTMCHGGSHRVLLKYVTKSEPHSYP